VSTKLRTIYEEGYVCPFVRTQRGTADESAASYRVIIISNQGGLKLHHDPKSKAPRAQAAARVTAFKQKCAAILSQLDIPTTIYAATGRDIFRKPRAGIWNEVLEDYGLEPGDVDMEGSFFVGDAAGRVMQVKGGDATVAAAKDFSCSDRNFAHNVGVSFMTPEEYFLGLEPREFRREFDLANHPFSDAVAEGAADDVAFVKKAGQELVVFCGPPGAGKSTYYFKYLKPLGFERVNQDTLKR
jgi:bifunctional polynucleotide phosphatase/kinase